MDAQRAIEDAGVHFAAIAEGIRKEVEPLGFYVYVNPNRRTIKIYPKHEPSTPRHP